MKMGLTLLGLMSGTSADELDGAVMTESGSSFRLIASYRFPIPPALRKRVLNAQQPGVRISLADWMRLDRDLGIWFARGSQRFISDFEAAYPVRIDAVACHGQTLLHLPDDAPSGLTLQAGNLSMIGAATRKTVIGQFREGDLSLGRQGAPLLPAYHSILARTLPEFPMGVSIHNLGGISNFSYFHPQSAPLYCDTGPANLWMDACVALGTKGKRTFDRGGKLAAAQPPDAEALKRLLRHPYLRKAPPKSTGRDDFTFEFFKRAFRKRFNWKTGLSTALEFSAVTIAQGYQRYVLGQGLPLSAIYFCGGGAQNQSLLRRVSELLPQCKVRTFESDRAKSIESEGFAYFGYRALKGFAPMVESGPAPHILPGENWAELIRKLAAEK